MWGSTESQISTRGTLRFGSLVSYASTRDRLQRTATRGKGNSSDPIVDGVLFGHFLAQERAWQIRDVLSGMFWRSTERLPGPGAPTALAILARGFRFARATAQTLRRARGRAFLGSSFTLCRGSIRITANSVTRSRWIGCFVMLEG